MAPDWQYKNHPAVRSIKEDLSIDTTFDPSYISWDTPFKDSKDFVLEGNKSGIILKGMDCRM
jgi:hypothetical protein